MTNRNTCTGYCLGLLGWILAVICCTLPAAAELRKIKIGETLPEFTLPEIDNKDFSYKHENSIALAIAFLSTNQTQSLHALEDIQNVIEDLHKKTDKFDMFIVLNESDGEGPIELLRKNSKPGIHILMDPNYKLWGLLGIIARPTTIVADPTGKILWTQAGYGYDFQPSLRLHLAIAAGIEDSDKINEKVQVQTLENSSIQARIDRHLQMRKILEEKEHFELAMEELQHALDLDPNSIFLALDLAELNCRTGKPQAALAIIFEKHVQKKPDQARVSLIQGWANAQLGQLDLAEKSLLTAIDLDPNSSRALFELGKIYQAKGQTESALDLYYKALNILFSDPKKTNFSQE